MGTRPMAPQNPAKSEYKGWRARLAKNVKAEFTKGK